MFVARDASCQFVLTAVTRRAVSHPVADPPCRASTHNSESTSLSQPFVVRQLASCNPCHRLQIGWATTTSNQTIRSGLDWDRGPTRARRRWLHFLRSRRRGTHFR
jgi:hypothetical protein